MSDPTPADFTADLAALEHRQALLHAALAAFQAGIPQSQPLGAYGLALYHRLAVVNDEHSIEAVLVHSAGGEIASGFLPLGEPHEILGLQKMAAELLCQRPWPDALIFSKPQQTQSPITMPLEQAPPAAAVEPEPEPDALPDEPPTAEEVAAIKDDLDHIFNRRPSAVKEVIAAFRAAYDVGARTPVAKAITTREHVAWLRAQINPILAEIANFEQNVKAGVAESIAQGAA
jgi:hypothetical protein